ncbi:UNVERIFIED_CONTAM: hypothetical protein K2H54_038968 [Gekko kuhli]
MPSDETSCRWESRPWHDYGHPFAEAKATKSGVRPFFQRLMGQHFASEARVILLNLPTGRQENGIIVLRPRILCYL